MIGIKRFIRPHYSHQILSVAQVDDIMSVAARQHVDGLDLVARDLELDHLIGADLAFLNKAMPRYHNEEFLLGVVPVLPLDDTGLGNVH